MKECGVQFKIVIEELTDDANVIVKATPIGDKNTIHPEKKQKGKTFSGQTTGGG